MITGTIAQFLSRQQPLATGPITIFFVVLAIILLAPVLLNRLRIPHIVGMIVAGVIVGPYGLNIIANDSSFEIFGQVGLLYLMFLAGLEIDMYHLKLNLRRGMTFGVLTFAVPMALGFWVSSQVLHLDMLTSTLLGSMFASHTLISYPIVGRYGITKSPAVLMSIVGTIFAVVGALIVLAISVNIYQIGEFRLSELGKLGLRVAVYCGGVILVYPRVTRWFMKRYSDAVTQYVFILAMVLLSAWIASSIQLEGVLGAFLAGLVLNRFVPSASPLMSRIEFVGNAIFIPYFLIGVGMMINLHVIANRGTLIVAGIMLGVALVSKWMPAWVAALIYRMPGAARRVMFGLTTAHTAVALAVVTIGYNMTRPDGSRMLDATVLNATVLVILITCAIAPIVTTSAASKLKMLMLDDAADETNDPRRHASNVLIPVTNPITAQSLVDLAILMSDMKGRGRGANNFYALHVRNDNTHQSRAIGRNSLNLAREAAVAVDVDITPIERFDINTVTGVLNVIEERDIDALVMGMHRKTTVIDSFLGPKIEQLLTATSRMLVLMRCYIPVNTVARIIVTVPQNAQYESGFGRWVRAIGSLGQQLGCRVTFCGHPDVHGLIAGVLKRGQFAVRAEYKEMRDHDDFVLLSREVGEDDLFVWVSARPNTVSYSPDMAELPSFMQRYYANNNLLVVYPEQMEADMQMQSFADPLAVDLGMAPSPIWSKLRQWLYRRRRR
ncbi:MAG: cation:proton antiporter [Muribaculaceae bacterium]|nr:cation:proton antiporter [Muribaculaceae bacterium]